MRSGRVAAAAVAAAVKAERCRRWPSPSIPAAARAAAPAPAPSSRGSPTVSRPVAARPSRGDAPAGDRRYQGARLPHAPCVFVFVCLCLCVGSMQRRSRGHGRHLCKSTAGHGAMSEPSSESRGSQERARRSRAQGPRAAASRRQTGTPRAGWRVAAEGFGRAPSPVIDEWAARRRSELQRRASIQPEEAAPGLVALDPRQYP